MQIELSKQEIELLECVLFDAIIKPVNTPERSEMEKLKYKLWKERMEIRNENK